jgi:hypothetical protein
MGRYNDLTFAEIVEDGFEISKVIGSSIIESICNWIFVPKCISQTSLFDYVGTSHQFSAEFEFFMFC